MIFEPSVLKLSETISAVCPSSEHSSTPLATSHLVRSGGDQGEIRPTWSSGRRCKPPQLWGGPRRAAEATPSLQAAQAARRGARGRPEPSEAPTGSCGRCRHTARRRLSASCRTVWPSNPSSPWPPRHRAWRRRRESIPARAQAEGELLRPPRAATLRDSGVRRYCTLLLLLRSGVRRRGGGRGGPVNQSPCGSNDRQTISVEWPLSVCKSSPESPQSRGGTT